MARRTFPFINCNFLMSRETVQIRNYKLYAYDYCVYSLAPPDALAVSVAAATMRK